MNCKYCNEPLEEGCTQCPACSKEQEITPEETVEVICEETAAEETVEEIAEAPAEEIEEESEEVTVEDSEEESEVAAAAPAPAQPKLWKLIAGCIGCAVLLGVLVFAVLKGMGVEIKFPKNDISRKDSYSVDEDTMGKSASATVAKVGDRKLTNSLLQIHYWNHVYDTLNYYGQYYGSYPFDPATPLEEQMQDAASGTTWQQYFIQQALTTWHRYEALCIMAENAGHTLSEDMQLYLDGLYANLEQNAASNGVADVETLIKDNYGSACTYADYEAYMRSYCMSLDYVNALTAQINPTDDEALVYYEENKDVLVQSGISAEYGLTSNVRHILISPEGGVYDETTGTTNYSDDEWNAAYTEAENLLNQWKAGDATEESFTALAETHSDDTGVAQNSGLYEGVNISSNYVEEFRNWAIDSTRQVGDTDIVRSSYGYHIMYFVSGEPTWLAACKETLISEQISKMVDSATKENTMDVTYRKIALIDLFAAAAAETEPTE